MCSVLLQKRLEAAHIQDIYTGASGCAQNDPAPDNSGCMRHTPRIDQLGWTVREAGASSICGHNRSSCVADLTTHTSGAHLRAARTARPPPQILALLRVLPDAGVPCWYACEVSYADATVESTDRSGASLSLRPAQLVKARGMTHEPGIVRRRDVLCSTRCSCVNVLYVCRF